MGQLFASRKAVKQALQRWSTLCLHRQFKVLKSNPHVYDVCCMKGDCPFRVHAYCGKRKDYWEVTRVVQHTCILEELQLHHRNLTADFVAQHMYAQIVEKPNYEPKSIICAIEEEFKYKISYSKAYRAKEKVLELRWGTFEASYHNLPCLLQTICQRNRGSYYDFKSYRCASKPGKQVLQRAFLALGACIEAFQCCRPVVCIDGTFLTGRYKGTMLTAIGADGNNQVLPLAIAFVEKECGDSWYWFLERVRQMVVKGRPDVCVIHDRHKGILQAILDIQNG